jgi:predicted XRE-type DNA-binding protein
MSDHDRDAPEFVASCGNVFADLGLENADEEPAKAQLAFAIRQRIRSKGLSQTDVASLLGTDQSKVSLRMNGRIGGFAYDRLLRFLFPHCAGDGRSYYHRTGSR